jgi:Caspase domain
MRKALVVGIDYYSHISGLHGCVNDAHSVKGVLERHGDGTVNFGVALLTGTGPSNIASRSALKDSIEKLFSDDSETALLYFAGHAISRQLVDTFWQVTTGEAMRVLR